MGTHNALLRLSDSSYLEVIAVDPDASPPMRPRWFGLDGLAPDDAPRLATWVVRVDDLDASMADSPEPLGAVVAMTRGPFAWRITVPPDGRPPLGGVVPALIAWSSAHPALGIADRGCRLDRLEAWHPDRNRVERVLRAMHAPEIAVVKATSPEAPSLVATIETPNGLRRVGAAT